MIALKKLDLHYSILLCCVLLFVLINNMAVSASTSTGNIPGSMPVEEVNLATGDITMPLSLASLPGISDQLIFGLNILYSSNIQADVSAWNIEQSTGLVGLGWSLSNEKVLVDKAGTLSKADDTYYLQTSGQRYELAKLSTKNGIDSYQTKGKFTNWLIRYEQAKEKWVVTKETGIEHHFGGGVNDLDTTTIPSSAGNSVEWGISWGNWIGSSVKKTNQTHFALAWNLSKVVDNWNNKITFKYNQVDAFKGSKAILTEAVGSGGKLFTKAAYLTTVTGTYGDQLKLYYKDMHSYEYQDPHTENNEPDAYQERYENQYLNNIDILNDQGTVLFTTKLRYNENTGDLGSKTGAEDTMRKRLLTSVIRKNNQNTALMPAHRFTYWGEKNSDGVTGITKDKNGVWQADLWDKKTGAFYGALKSITMPSGAITSYQYNKQGISNAQRKLSISRPSSSWQEPQILHGPDYIGILWFHKNNDKISVSVYDWEGRWISNDLGEFPIDSKNSVKATLQGTFFGLLTPKQEKSISIFYKDFAKPGKWHVKGKTKTLSNGTKLASGNHFIVTLDTKTHEVFAISSQDEMNWSSYSDKLRKADNMKYGLTARNNYFFTASDDKDHDESAQVRLYTFDSSTGDWNKLTKTVSHYLTRKHCNAPCIAHTDFSGILHINLLAGDSFVALEAYDKTISPGVHHNFVHYIYSWTDDFSSIKEEKIKETTTSNVILSSRNTATFFTDNLQMVVVSTDDGKWAYRYNGKSWKKKKFDNDSINDDFADIDVTVTTKNEKAKLEQYNPNVDQWNKALSFDSGNPSLWRKHWDEFILVETMVVSIAAPFLGAAEVVGGALALAATAINTTDWVLSGIDIFMPVNDGIGSIPQESGRFFTSKNDVFFRSHQGDWSRFAKLVDNLPFSTKVDSQSTQSAIDFITYTTKKNSPSCRRYPKRADCHSSNIQLLKNGAFFQAPLQLPNSESLKRDIKTDTSSLIGGNTVVTYSGGDKLKDASKLNLYYYSQDNIDGKMYDTVVSRIEVDDGYNKTYTHLEYAKGSADFDVAGITAIYNHVTVVPSGNSATKNTANGWHKEYFLTSQVDSHSSGIKSNTVQLCTAKSDCRDVSYGSSYHAFSSGLPYHREFKDSAGNSVATFSTRYQVYQTDILAKNKKSLGRNFAIRPVVQIDKINNSEHKVEFKYDFDTARITQTKIFERNNKGETEITKQTISYAADIYPELKSLNFLNRPAQVITEVERDDKKTVIDNVVTTWKNFNNSNKWDEDKGFIALNNKPGNFDFNKPPGNNDNNWLMAFDTTLLKKDNGRLLEYLDHTLLYNSSIYDKSSRFEIAHFSNASVSNNQAGYTGFENYEDLSSWNIIGKVKNNAGFTGAQALSGNNAISITKDPVGYNGNEVYIVSAQVKPKQGQRCTVGFGNDANRSSTKNQWQYIEYVSTQPNGFPIVKCNNGGSIDDFRFAPVNADFSATVYDTEYFDPIAMIDSNGGVRRISYDERRRLSIVEEPGEIRNIYYDYYYSREGNNDNFNANDPNAFTNGFGNTPNSKRKTINYSDGLDRPIQIQTAINANASIVSQVFYDGWGHPAIRTLPAKIKAGFAYNKKFAKYDWDSGIISGDVADYYKTGDGQRIAATGDHHYVYYRTVYEDSPMVRPILHAKPGKTFAYRPDKDSHYVSTQAYGIEDSEIQDENIAKTVLKPFGLILDSRNEKFYDASKTSQPLDNTNKLNTVMVTTQNHRLIGTVTGSETGAERIQRSFDYNYNFSNGGSSLVYYMPNAHLNLFSGLNNAFATSTTLNYLGQVITHKTPDTGKTKHLYDRMGRLRFAITEEGKKQSPNQVKYWRYDVLNRVIEEGYLERDWDQLSQNQLNNPNYPNNINTWRVRYTFDLDDNNNSSNLKGRLYKIETNSDNDGSDIEISTRYSYDVAGRPLTVSLQMIDFDNKTRTTQYAYNEYNETVQITYPDNTGLDTVVTYQLNNLGQIKNIGTPDDNKFYASYQYNADGSIFTESSNVSSNQPTIRTYDYNIIGNLLSIKDELNGKTLFKEVLDYTVNGVYQDGNIQSLKFKFSPEIGASNYSYQAQYDDFGRLTQAKNSAKKQWDYGVAGNTLFDLNGNLATLSRGKSSQDYQYYNNTNRVKNIDGAGNDYQYDKNGRVTKTPTLKKISYDPFTGMSTSIKIDNNNNVKYQYQAGTQRVYKSFKAKSANDSEEALYVLGMADLTLADITKKNSQDQVQKYIYGPSGIIAITDDSHTYFLSNDHMASTRLVRDETNNIAAYYSYFPYGEALESGGNLVDVFRYRYTMQEYDDETGLYNYRARLYDSALAKFYEPDPLSAIDNPYDYVDNNPFNYTDPSGMVKPPIAKASISDRFAEKLLLNQLPVKKAIVKGKLRDINSRARGPTVVAVMREKNTSSYVIGANQGGSLSMTKLKDAANDAFKKNSKKSFTIANPNEFAQSKLTPIGVGQSETLELQVGGGIEVEVHRTAANKVEIKRKDYPTKKIKLTLNTKKKSGIVNKVTLMETLLGRDMQVAELNISKDAKSGQFKFQLKGHLHAEMNVAITTAKKKGINLRKKVFKNFFMGSSKANCKHCTKIIRLTGAESTFTSDRSFSKWTCPHPGPPGMRFIKPTKTWLIKRY